MDPAPVDLATIEEIRQVKYRYLRCVDLKLWDELAAVFTPDATVDYGTQVYGKPLKLDGRDAIVGFLRKNLGPTMITVHRAGQPEITVDDAAIQLAYASKVVFVPGYGLATAQAQHAVRELANVLEERGVIVKYGIHPVAGRMPGHMNVLLAEANVPYSQLYELEQINPELSSTDVSVVIGANDVVNPDARDNPSSPIAGMPIIEVDRSKSVIVLKRGQGKGFSGLENPLFFKPVTGMLYGDAKDTLTKLVSAVQHA